MIAQYTHIFINLQGINYDKADFCQFADSVKEKYKLCLISNQDTDADFSFFAKFIGEEMGFRLPSLAIFDKAVEILGCKPAECMYVDSDIKNIHSAEEVGMSPILFYNGEGYYDTTVYSFSELNNFI